MNRLILRRRRFRRTLLAHRRLLAALAAASAVAAGLQAAAAPPPPTTLVLTAAHDIPGGTVVTSSDLRRVPFAPDSIPSGVLTSAPDVVGRTTAGPVRAGEPITDVRLVAGSLLESYPGMVAAPVRIADAGAVDLLEVGDRIDILAADPRGRSEAVVVASGASVIAIPEAGEDVAPAVPGGLIVVAIPDETAQTVAAAGVSRILSIVITH